jgi:hypothetical protein
MNILGTISAEQNLTPIIIHREQQLRRAVATGICRATNNAILCDFGHLLFLIIVFFVNGTKKRFLDTP